MTDELERRLQQYAESARPAAGATDRIAAAVTARRRRRTALTTGVAALAVVGVVGGASALSGRGPDREPTADQTATTPPTIASSPTAPAGYTGYTCPRDEAVTDRVPPPILDLAEQQAVVAELESTQWKTMDVKVARPSPLGVVVLVERTDMTLAEARSFLVREHGAGLVYDWDPSGPSVGLDADGQVTQVLAWQVQEVLPTVRQAVRGRDGYVNLWVWPDAASIQVFWHGEVPADVQAMVGDLGNGVRLDPIIPTVLSMQTLEQAQDGSVEALTDWGLRDKWSTTGKCHDYSGLVVGVQVADPGRRSELSQRLQQELGVPVMVVDEDPPVDLVDR